MANSVKVDTEMIEEAARSLHSLAKDYETVTCRENRGESEGQFSYELDGLYVGLDNIGESLVALIEETALFLDEFCRVTNLSDQQNAGNIRQ